MIALFGIVSLPPPPRRFVGVAFPIEIVKPVSDTIFEYSPSAAPAVSQSPALSDVLQKFPILLEFQLALKFFPPAQPASPSVSGRKFVKIALLLKLSLQSKVALPLELE